MGELDAQGRARSSRVIRPFPRAARVPESSRWTAGIQVSSDASIISAALVATTGHGLQCQVQIVADAVAPVPTELAQSIRKLIADESVSPTAAAQAALQLAEIESALVDEILLPAQLPRERLLLIGVDDPGIWRFDATRRTDYVSLCDAATLAESTNCNIVEAFPARDLAQGGLGGPVFALAEWVLLKHRARTRLLLDLGRTVRMTYLPSAQSAGPSRVLSFDGGPGTRLLDMLARRLTDGTQSFDPGGSLAVQGRQIPDLVAHWLKDPYFERTLPRWHPWGVRPERFLAESVQMAIDRGWSIRDLLCSATHFIAETIPRAIARLLPDTPAIEEVVITGGGKQNGLLLRAIAGRLSGVELTDIANLGIAPSTLGAASAAVLALLQIDQTPANHPAITGTAVPRALGRLTPGPPQAWLRLARHMVHADTTGAAFRKAV
jgi:1,6-anhydro-N-acetylmuramate kinase